MRLISIRILVREIARNDAKSEFPGENSKFHSDGTDIHILCIQLFEGILAIVCGYWHSIVVNGVYLYQCLGEPDLYLHSDSSAGELFDVRDILRPRESQLDPAILLEPYDIQDVLFRSTMPLGFRFNIVCPRQRRLTFPPLAISGLHTIQFSAETVRLPGVEHKPG